MCQSQNFSNDKRRENIKVPNSFLDDNASSKKRKEKQTRTGEGGNEVQTAGGKVIAYTREEKHTFLHQ